MAARSKVTYDRAGGCNDDSRRHYGPYDSESFKLSAPCGYTFQKRLRGLDRCVSWDSDAPMAVDCVDCLMHRPARWKVRKWNSVGFYGKKRRV